jgi:predicted tellurium resistance membrane protein TerC
VFLAILAGRLPPAQQVLARGIGLALALVMRLLLLGVITWIMLLTFPLFSIPVSRFPGAT